MDDGPRGDTEPQERQTDSVGIGQDALKYKSRYAISEICCENRVAALRYDSTKSRNLTCFLCESTRIARMGERLKEKPPQPLRVSRARVMHMMNVSEGANRPEGGLGMEACSDQAHISA